MALNLNKVLIAGNLTRDPETRSFGNERMVANFGLASNRRYRTADGEQKEEVTFVDVECWGRTAELVAQYMTKGRACLVEGRLKLDSWEANDGSKRSKLKVVADMVHFLGDRKDGGDDAGRSRSAAPAADRPAVPPPADDGGMLDDDSPPF